MHPPPGRQHAPLKAVAQTVVLLQEVPSPRYTPWVRSAGRTTVPQESYR